MINYILLGIIVVLLAINISMTVWLIRIITDKFEELQNSVNNLARDTYNGLDWIYNRLPKPRAKKKQPEENEETLK